MRYTKLTHTYLLALITSKYIAHMIVHVYYVHVSQVPLMLFYNYIPLCIILGEVSGDNLGLSSVQILLRPPSLTWC